jgi:hypothetical protein
MSRPRPTSVEDLFTGTRLKAIYMTDDVYAWFQKRHKKVRPLIDEAGVFHTRDGEHEWKVPYGLRIAIKEPLKYTQMVNKYPYYVTWVSPKSGKRLLKYFMSIPHAIEFIASKAQYVDEDVCVVSRHGYYIPRKLMGKFPRKMGPKKLTHYWCPRCMQPRRFRRVEGETFYAMKKEWSNEKSKYVWKDRELALLRCEVCGITNRDTKFRASNQPLEVRKIKERVRRIKKTRKRR